MCVESRWWFQIFFIFTPNLGEKISNLTNIFQMGWHHQLVNVKKVQKTTNRWQFRGVRCLGPPGRILNMWLIASENDNPVITSCLDKANEKNGMKQWHGSSVFFWGSHIWNICQEWGGYRWNAKKAKWRIRWIFSPQKGWFKIVFCGLFPQPKRHGVAWDWFKGPWKVTGEARYPSIPWYLRWARKSEAIPLVGYRNHNFFGNHHMYVRSVQYRCIYWWCVSISFYRFRSNGMACRLLPSRLSYPHPQESSIWSPIDSNPISTTQQSKVRRKCIAPFCSRSVIFWVLREYLVTFHASLYVCISLVQKTSTKMYIDRSNSVKIDGRLLFFWKTFSWDSMRRGSEWLVRKANLGKQSVHHLGIITRSHGTEQRQGK